MKAQLLTTWTQISFLENKWNKLLKESEADSIFLTWEWIQSWRQAVKKEIRPFVIIVTSDNNDELIGIVPFHIKDLVLFNAMVYQALCIMADSKTGSEYPDIIAKKQNESLVCHMAAEILIRTLNMWDCIWLPRVAEWSGAVGRWQKIKWSAKLLLRERFNIFSSLSLLKDENGFISTLSLKRQKQIQRLRNRILCRNDVEICKCSEKHEIDSYLESLFVLHNNKWGRKGVKGVFIRKPEEKEFYKRFANHAYDNGWLRIYAIREKGKVKAIQYGYVYNGTFNQLQEGYDPDYIKGVGNVLRIIVIEDLIERGITKYDFLGGYSEHKRRWNAIPQRGMDIFMVNRKICNFILFFGRMWPSGRFVKI